MEESQLKNQGMSQDNIIYVDNAATTLRKPPEVLEAVTQALRFMGNSGRGAHEPTLYASRIIYQARENLADLLGAEDSSCIAFTSNVTESLNLAIRGLIKPGDHVISTECEHNSVLRPLYRLEKEGASLTLIPADKKGRLDYNDLNKALRPETKALVITHASNLTGNVTDLEKAANFTKENGLLLIVDGAQGAGTLPVDVQKAGIDVFCFTGHKSLYGPQGTGGLYVRKGLLPDPLKTGGSGVQSYLKEQPHEMPVHLEAGTLNGHGIAGLSAGVSFILDKGVSAIHEKEDCLARRLASELQKIPGVRLYGDMDAPLRAPIVSFNIGDMDSAEVSDILWEDYRICTRAGAHCAPLLHKALGTEEQGAVRVSFSWYNTLEEVDRIIEAVRDIAEEIPSHS